MSAACYLAREIVPVNGSTVNLTCFGCARCTEVPFELDVVPSELDVVSEVPAAAVTLPVRTFALILAVNVNS